MFYKNARIFGSDFQFHNGGFEVRDGRFGKIVFEDEQAFSSLEEKRLFSDAEDLQGATVIPGLVEIHSHGNSGADFSDGDYEGLVKMAGFYAKNGITSFAPASMTLPYEQLTRAFQTALQLQEIQPEGVARLVGVHMEGPYFSFKKRGAQNPEYLKEPDVQGFGAMYEAFGDLLSIVDLAPELPGAEAFVKEFSDKVTVSVAHTDADYEQACAVYDAGARHLTHMFNAMPGIHHRNPGVIAAASERKFVTAELICDGYHVHPAAVRLAFQLLGADRIALISDSGRCAGMPEGSEFFLGGQKCFLKDGVGRLTDGTIACSAANLWDCMVNVMRWGIPEEDAVKSASYTPAKVLRKESEIGMISSGRIADFVITNADYSSRRVFLAGNEL